MAFSQPINRMTFKSLVKGFVGELVVTAGKKLFLDAETYFDVNNVTIPTANGTTQIDHVIVSRYGIFVVETKNMMGWIFGDENQAEWTQSLPGGRKFRFQNPLRQNYRHTRALAEFLCVPHDKLFSIVFFIGECEFKTPMPANVLTQGYTTYIKSKTDALFSDEEVKAYVEAIKTGMMPKGLLKSFETRRTHLDSLEQRHASITTCPKCGSPLSLRTVKAGEKAGSRFYGCSAFPKCRFTKPFDENAPLS